MQAELDYVNGQPVLRMERRTGGIYNGKRTVMDLPLTQEQLRTVKLMELS